MDHTSPTEKLATRIAARRRTAGQRLADKILHDRYNSSLHEFLEAARRAGASYERIARELANLTDQQVSVSYQTVKRWLADFDIEAA